MWKSIGGGDEEIISDKAKTKLESIGGVVYGRWRLTNKKLDTRITHIGRA